MIRIEIGTGTAFSNSTPASAPSLWDSVIYRYTTKKSVWDDVVLYNTAYILPMRNRGYIKDKTSAKLFCSSLTTKTSEQDYFFNVSYIICTKYFIGQR
jgi:hypothetical protein